jgi:CRP-like cAMP-binding protein
MCFYFSSTNEINCFLLCRVFGHFERPIFLELCRSLESKNVLAGAYLFRIGDVDDSLYVVQKGLLHVFITDEVRSINIDLFKK